METPDERRSEGPPRVRRWQRTGTNPVVALSVWMFGFALSIIAVLYLIWFLINGWSVWRYGSLSQGPAEIEVAAAEAIYQPIIGGGVLDWEDETGAFRSPVDGVVPTSVTRHYLIDGLFVEAAQAYMDAAVADGWVLQESECSSPDLVSVLRFRDPTNESRGEVRIGFSPQIGQQFVPRKILTATPTVTVTIEVTTAPAEEAAVFQPPTCLDVFVQAMLANGLPRRIEPEEILGRITPELLDASGVGEALVANPERHRVRFMEIDDRGTRAALTVKGAEWTQIAARWERQPDEVFSFTDDGDDYWYAPVDGGALIIELHKGLNGEVVTDEAMLNLGLALRDG